MEIIATHELTDVTLAAHSYGTFVAAAAVKHYPQLAHRLVLADPVCLYLFKHDIVYNAIYRSVCVCVDVFLCACVPVQGYVFDAFVFFCQAARETDVGSTKGLWDYLHAV